MDPDSVICIPSISQALTGLWMTQLNSDDKSKVRKNGLGLGLSFYRVVVGIGRASRTHIRD